jgi:hypothetical protein
MPKTTCNQQLYDGQQSRRNSPLFQGCYKIRETITEFSDMPAEIDRIRGVRMRKVSPGRLRHCTEEDAHVWIRNMPFNVAHSLGRNVLPGLLASVYEGASPHTVCKAYIDLLQRCEALTQRMDSALHDAGRDTLYTCHLLKPIMEEAVYITQQALAVADPNGRWK